MKLHNDKRELNLTKMFFWIVATLTGVVMGATVFSAEPPVVTIVYPKANSIVGNRVNLVLDPATDPSTVPFFQVVVNNKTEYPMIDLSSGKHAKQGLKLEQGINTITVRVLVKAVDESNKQTTVKMVFTRNIPVFNNEGLFSGDPPPQFTREYFHARENEAACSGCHRMEVAPDDLKHKNPADVLCFVCHKNIATGRNIHGPAAVWNCLGCHDAELFPVKYQFTSLDPWTVKKTVQAVGPMLYTYSSAELFKTTSAELVSMEKTRDLLKDILIYTKQNPADKIRIEVHTDSILASELVKAKGKGGGFRTGQLLTDRRAKVLASALKDLGIPIMSITAVGMSDSLPKASNNTLAGRELNNRVEVVVYPAESEVLNSQKIPVLRDRDRVLLNLNYAQGPQIKKLKVIEILPKGMHYVKGSGYFRGRPRDPKANGEEMLWELGDMDAVFSESLFYVVKKDNDSMPMLPEVTVSYTAGSMQLTRKFNAKIPAKRGPSVKDTCLKCHGSILNGNFKHGPVDAGYCNLCHDPHASTYRAWLRKAPWDLCTTCHAEKASGVHVIAGFKSGKTHPTRLKPDPMRPGKRLTCSSCHEPHSAVNKDLFAYHIKTWQELCPLCHAK